MRALAILLVTLGPISAQFRSTVPLVVAPTTIVDSRGRLVDGLTARDLVLYDNNVPQPIQVDTLNDPISLVVLLQTSVSATAVLDKLGGMGSLFSDLLSAEAGETALLAFSNGVRMVADFTADGRRLSDVLRNLRAQGNGVALLDGLGEALRLLAARDPRRRRLILVIGERRDRSSKLQLPELLRDPQLQNTTIYWLTFSTLLAPFTNRPKTKWDRMTDEQKNDPARMGIKYPLPGEDDPLPPEMAPGSLFNVFTELIHKSTADSSALLTRTTGGRTFSFLKQNGLENAIQAVAGEVHRQYIVTFQPKPDTPGMFHSLRAEVKDRPDLLVRTRAGYWSVK